MERSVSRVEEKYSLSPVSAARIEARLAAAMTRDPHGGREGYTVRSLYFDTPSDRDYADKVDGLKRRQKIRLRVYDGNMATARLEIKEKSGAWQRKRTLPVSEEELKQLIAGKYSVLLSRREALSAELYGRLSRDVYRPVCVVEYDREAFIGDCNEIRITLDRNLRCSAGDPRSFLGAPLFFPVGSAGATTLEVKYDGFLPSWIKMLLRTVDRSVTSASKYAASRCCVGGVIR